MPASAEIRGIGRSVRRTEDVRLLTGKGIFSDDLNAPGQIQAYVARSPHAHARLCRIDCCAALHSPGVIAMLTGHDYLAQGHKPLPSHPLPSGVTLKKRGSSALFFPPDYPLAIDKVQRYKLREMLKE